MKTKRSLVTLMAVAIVTLASATGNIKFNVVPLNADQIAVSVLTSDDFNFEIEIFTENGDIVYYKQTENPIQSYEKIFDIKELKPGVYSMKLKANDTNLEKDFVVTNSKIYMKQSDLSVDPYFVFDGENLKFSYLNFNRENFKMKIYDDAGLVYKTKIGDTFPIQSGYDLSKLENGNYKVVLSSFNREYSYQFQK